MSTSTVPTRRAPQAPPSRGLSFGGALHSEWVKLRSLRSTIWSFCLLFTILFGLGLLFSVLYTLPEGMSGRAFENSVVVYSITSGALVGELLVGVLGVLLIGGEYSTGQIRSSFAAVPKRLRVLSAKAIVFATTTFIVSLSALVATYFVSAPVLAGKGVDSSIWNWEIGGPILGLAAFLTLLGVISMGIGAIVRSTAGGIAGSLGLILVLPNVLYVMRADWATAIADTLPSIIGKGLFYFEGDAEPWQAALVMLAWLAAFFSIAVVLIKKRDA